MTVREVALAANHVRIGWLLNFEATPSFWLQLVWGHRWLVQRGPVLPNLIHLLLAVLGEVEVDPDRAR